MASGNVIITKTTNRVTFETARASYARAVKQIRSVGKEWEKVSNKMKPLKMPFQENAYTKVRRKQQDDAARAAITQAKEEAKAAAAAAKVKAAAERKLATIRAKGIRFSTVAANSNVTPAQRAGHL